MEWYLAKIVFRIICGEGKHMAQFDEQLRLIAATDTKAALNKAKTIGINTEECYLNQAKQVVHWKFINVAELYHLNKLVDGTELYSRIEENDEPENYIRIINKKAQHISISNT
ncbi:MAG TPA: DUF4288 domain-containing protein [Ferruginibacter sp.]|nr:DUF4288 domain-containing protein [Ferruginibacter sp.]